MLNASRSDILEASSLIYEMSGISIREQKNMKIPEWYSYYQMAMKRQKEKINIAMMGRF